MLPIRFYGLTVAFCHLCTALIAAPLTSYPLANEIKVGEAFGKVGPRFSRILDIPMTATVTVTFAGTTAVLEKDAVWGAVDPERLALEQAKLDNARLILAQKKASPDTEFKKIEGERRYNEIQGTLAALNGRDNSLIKKMDLGEDASKDYERQTKLAVDALTKELALLRGKLDAADAERAAELTTAELTLRSQEHEFRRASEAARLVMPERGRVTLLYPESKDKSYKVTAGTPFARIEDNSVYRVIVPVTNAAEWKEYAPESLLLRLRTASGRVLRARWAETLAEKVNGREESAYAFTLEPADADWAAAMSGTTVQFEVHKSSATPFRLVPKLQLASEHPGLFKDGADWQGVAAKLWPGCAVLTAGSRELAIAETGGAATSTRPAGEGGLRPKIMGKRPRP